MSYKNIALRSLNQTKTLNPIVYLGIRCYFEKLSKKSEDVNLLDEYIKRKLFVRKSWTFKESKLYKEKNEESYIYRDIISLSPFGVISESFLLRELVKEKCFVNKEFVYSYLLPKKTDSTRNYQYYFNGYKNRNEDISSVFDKNKEKIALVLDLQKFYPSINKEKINTLFLNEIKNKNEEIYLLSKNMISSQLNSSKDGVPIGTDFSHLMAQIYLEEFDINMAEKYKSRYFRYVDDIVIICDKDEVEDIIKYVEDLLPKELNINESKTDKLTYEDWNILSKSNDKENENFNDLLNFITAFISMHPLKIDELEKQLDSRGYNIPIRRIKKQSKSRNYMMFIESLMNGKGWTTFEIQFTKVEYIVEKLTLLKDFYLKKFNELIEFTYTNDNSAENRSNTQQLKFIMNRLLYLCSISELENLLIKIPNTEKFSDTKEVILALTTKNLINTIKFGGKVIQTVSELWKEYSYSKIYLEKNDLSKFENINDVVDSLIILYLYQVIDFEKSEIVELLNIDNKEYFLVMVDEKFVPQKTENEYVMELYGLVKNISIEKRYELLFTRYDNDESLQLSGLDLGIGYSL